MNSGGDAAEQIVRLSLEGIEVAAKLTGSAAKNVAVLLVAALKEEHKTQGKTRLTNMIRSGKELKVFSVPKRDLNKFVEQAKRYGVLYCVLQDKSEKGGSVPVDIIARAEDAAKIQRIFERFALGQVDKASIVTEAEKDRAERMKQKETSEPESPVNPGTPEKSGGMDEMSMGEQLMSGMVFTDEQEQETQEEREKNMPDEDGDRPVNPQEAEPDFASPSAPDYGEASDTPNEMQEPRKLKERTSVKEKLDRFKREAVQEKEKQQKALEQKNTRSRKKNRTEKKSNRQKKQSGKER